MEMLIATILSAQCTDVRVNEVTKTLFKKLRTAKDYADIPLAELEEMIRPTGFFRNKAKSIKGCCQGLVEKHGGKVPDSMEALVQLPGIGRKQPMSFWVAPLASRASWWTPTSNACLSASVSLTKRTRSRSNSSSWT